MTRLLWFAGGALATVAVIVGYGAWVESAAIDAGVVDW